MLVVNWYRLPLGRKALEAGACKVALRVHIKSIVSACPEYVKKPPGAFPESLVFFGRCRSPRSLCTGKAPWLEHILRVLRRWDKFRP